MNSKTINGILFIVAALSPIIVCLGLGTPDGTKILDAKMTGNLAFWLMLTTPIAFMMTADTMKS